MQIKLSFLHCKRPIGPPKWVNAAFQKSLQYSAQVQINAKRSEKCNFDFCSSSVFIFWYQWVETWFYFSNAVLTCWVTNNNNCCCCTLHKTKIQTISTMLKRGVRWTFPNHPSNGQLLLLLFLFDRFNWSSIKCVGKGRK